MKRILYSCLLFVSICLSGFLKAQTPHFTVTPQVQCYNATGIYTADAAFLPNDPAAATYTWVFAGPSPTCGPSFTPLPGGTPTNSNISMTFSCCGVYTVTAFGFTGTGGLTGTYVTTLEIICPGGAGAAVTTAAGTSTTGNGVVCIGESSTITPSGAATYTWSNGFVGNPLIVSPTTNTCYTFVGTTAQGCTVAPTGVYCVSVQAITATVSPATQSMCAGSPVHFTATAGVTTGTNVTAGTAITGYNWFPPVGPPSFSAGPTTSIVTHTSAQGGTYSVIVTHTGAAGTCSLISTAAVVITTNIPVSISPSSPSICPGGTISLNAVSIQTTTTTNYTWTIYNSTGSVISGFHGNPLNTSGTPTLSYVVKVNYSGCPGKDSINIGLLTLTPTLTSSGGLSTCPNKSLTLTASGGVSYTFTGVPTLPVATTYTLTKPTASTAIHTPSGANLPIQYCVSAYSTGCTGTTCIVVSTRTLQPVLTASSNSICPGTTFTLYSTTNGTNTAAGTTYTFSAGYNPNIGSGTSYSITHATPPPTTNTSLPQTYSVTADSAGCQGTSAITISSLTLLPILTSASPSICLGTALTLSATAWAGANYTFAASVATLNPPGSSTIITTTSHTVTHQPPASSSGTLITYTVTVDSAGCKGGATYSVGILDLGPTLTLTTLPLSGSVCPGTSFTLNASGAQSYTFFAPGTGAFSSTTSSTNNGTVSATAITPTLIGAGVVYTVQADSSKCTGSNTIVVHEFKLHPGISLSPTLVCSGMPVVVTATNVNTANTPGIVNYTFYTYSPTVPIPAVLPSAPGSFSTTNNPTMQLVYSVIADSAGCTSVLPPPTATINIRPDLVLVPSTSAASVCPGLTATLSVVAPTTALNYTYTWSQTTGTGQIAPPAPPFTSSIVAYPTANSNYSVNVIDSLGCVGNTVIAVGIDPLISFSINLASSGSTICAGQSVSLTASSTVALNNNSLGTINYTWTPATSISPTTGTLVVGNPAVTTNYTVTADNGYGCFAQNTIDIPVGTTPSITINNTAPGGICVGFTATLTAFGANSYTWTGSTFTNSIPQQSISVIPANPTAQYTVLGSNGGGCTNIAVQTVSLLPNFVLNPVANSPTTCIASNTPKFSKPVHLTVSGAATYAWFPYNPLHMTYSLGTQTDVRPPVTTQYTVIGSTAICSGSGVVTVIVIPQFTINVVPPLPAMCLGDSLKLSIVNIGTNAAQPASSFKYNWAEALNAPPISISNYFTSTVMVYPQNTTTYSTEVLDAAGCISFPKLVTVTVLPQPITAIAIPTINSVATNTVCYVGLNPGAQDVTINLTGNNMNTGLQFGVVPTYTWISPYAPTYISILTPANNNAVTVNAPVRVLNSSAVAVYTLISGYNGVQGCKRIDTVSVRVVDCRPVFSLTFTTAEPNDTICSRNCVTYINQTDTMAGGPQSYTWTFSGGSPATSHEQNPTVCYNFPGKYNVILKVSNPYPVINTLGGPPGSTLALGSLNYIKVVDIPNVTIVAPGQVRSDTIVRFGQSVNLNGSGALTYDWSPAYNITSLTKPKVTVNPFKTTQYILTGYNSKHCSSSDTINVIIVENCGEMYVPNAFSPNNDGVNDVLYVRGICLQSLTFMVFDRWGEKVFETADQKVGWDGTYKGEEMNTGVFVYRLEGKAYDGKGFSSKGNITLIR